MQKKILEGFRQFDAFGALYQTTITYQQKEYKTFFGALITIVLYGISLAFLFYNIIQWQTGQILPKIITTNVVYSEYEFTYPDVLFSISGDPQRSRVNIDFIQVTNDTNNDPFDPQALLIQPMLLINSYDTSVPFPYEIKKNAKDLMYSLQFLNMTFKYQLESSKERPTVYFSLMLGACVNSTLPSGMVCASQDKIDQFLSQSLNYLIGTIKLKQYNSNTRKAESIDSSMYVMIDKANAYYGQVNLNVQKTIIDEGFLFPSYTSVTYISSTQEQSQSLPNATMYQFFQKEMYLVSQFKISPIVSEQVVQFPKFNEILADTGSMVSAIFYISILAKFINERFQDMEVINQVISFYYPKFKHIKIQNNWLGQYSKVFYQGKALDPIRFKIYYEKLIQTARQKLSLSNQLYEISRLQFIIQSIQSRKYILQSHRIGIQMQDFMNYPQILEKNQSQALPMMNSIIQSNDEKIEKNVSKVDSDEFIQLKQNNSIDLKIYKSEQLQEGSGYQLSDQDFSLLVYNESEESSQQAINDIQETNLIEFYKQNQVE